MKHTDKKRAKRIDTPNRSSSYTDAVYAGASAPHSVLHKRMYDAEHQFDLQKPNYNVYIGEMHGHTSLSDGNIDIDTYFKNLQSRGLDFAAITDHDHGGVGNPELWSGTPSKWDTIMSKVSEYYKPNEFTTLLAYERDSYPFYNNLVVYFRSARGEMIRGIRDGEITESELRNALARNNILLIPHDTYSITSAADFVAMDTSLITPLMEIYSRGDAAEYMGNPAFSVNACREGGFFQDALKRGAKIGCIGGSDDHNGMGGAIVEKYGYPSMYPGLTGVWAKENTRESIFDAIFARRCYAFMGGRMTIDFRINDHMMGEQFELKDDEHLTIWFDVTADAPIKQVTVVKNSRDIIILKNTKSQLLFDYSRENSTDYFYLRVELADNRFGWTSPIWINTKK